MCRDPAIGRNPSVPKTDINIITTGRTPTSRTPINRTSEVDDRGEGGNWSVSGAGQTRAADVCDTTASPRERTCRARLVMSRKGLGRVKTPASSNQGQELTFGLRRGSFLHSVPHARDYLLGK